jgi:hypothetical protein
MSLLWTTEDLIAATGGRPFGQMPAGVSGISIDTRTLSPGDAFFAIRGGRLDGHDYATAAIKAGAGLLVVSEGKLPALGRLTAPKIVVPDVLHGLERAGIAARARTRAKIIAVTGSAGKTSTKDALRLALGAVGKCRGSLAQQSLGRAADPCPHAERVRLRRFRNRHEQRRRDPAAGPHGPAAHRHHYADCRGTSRTIQDLGRHCSRKG